MDSVNIKPIQKIFDTTSLFEINRRERTRKNKRVIRSITLSSNIVAKEALFDILSVWPIAKALINSPPLAGRMEFAINPTDKVPKVFPKWGCVDKRPFPPTPQQPTANKPTPSA